MLMKMNISSKKIKFNPSSKIDTLKPDVKKNKDKKEAWISVYSWCNTTLLRLILVVFFYFHQLIDLNYRSSYSNQSFAWVLPGDTVAPLLCIICQHYKWILIGLMKENSFTLKKKQDTNNIQQKLLLM